MNKQFPANNSNAKIIRTAHNYNNSNKEKKMEKEHNQFDFCEVCKLNHDQGRRHNFFPKHKTNLSSYLSRFQSKLSDVRFFLKNPSLLRPQHASLNRFWCSFCESDIHEIHSSYACANAINHLASGSHLKSLKNFLWKYGCAMDRIDSFRISETDLTKMQILRLWAYPQATQWEKKCKLLNNEAAGEGSQGLLTGHVNNIHNELNSDNIFNFDKNSIHDVNSSFSNVVPLQSHTIEKYQVSHSEYPKTSEVGGLLHGANLYTRSTTQTDTGPRSSKCLPDYMNNQHAINPKGRIGSHANGLVKQVLRDERTTNGEQSFPGLQKLTPVPSLVSEEAQGNVHSGGPPPWFNSTVEKQLNEKLKPGNSSKLNPKRVGAAWAERRKIEMEMEKRGEIVTTKFDSNWLPDFGRVWQSGSRKESRKEFQAEINSSHKDENQNVTPVQLQPYVSKRLFSSTENRTEINMSCKDENQTATPIQLQPYVSKRLRRDAGD